MEAIDSARVREKLRDALQVAMRGRDSAATAAFRSALGAIDNAEAVDVSHAPRPDDVAIANAVLGAGSADVPRKHLSLDEVLGIIRAEVEERAAAAVAYERSGRTDRSIRLLAEAAALESFLSSTNHL